MDLAKTQRDGKGWQAMIPFQLGVLGGLARDQEKLLRFLVEQGVQGVPADGLYAGAQRHPCGSVRGIGMHDECACDDIASAYGVSERPHATLPIPKFACSNSCDIYKVAV